MNNRILENIEPASVFRFFEEISNIPRGSGNEKEISDYIVKFAKERELEYVQDSFNNVIIKKAASAGYENAPTVIVQGHIDMVCEKNSFTKHNFEKDPLKLVVDVDYIKAEGTTLGADNGIAVAFALALLDSKEISHPPLEILLTTDEERGMVGAKNLDVSNLKGKILINIDNEEEGELLVSCAGGVRAKVNLPVSWKQISGNIGARIKISGLKGGHSGMDINKERGNSNKLLSRILINLLDKLTYELAAINGGSKDNAIPREAEAEIYINEDSDSILNDFIDEWNKILKNEFASADPNINIRVEYFKVEESVNVLKDDSKISAIKLLYMFPNGVSRRSTDIENLVLSSTNLGTLKTLENSIRYDSAIRGSIKSLKEDIALQVSVTAAAFGAKLELKDDYPEWQYSRESEIRDVFMKVHRTLYDKDAKIVAIHAGVECGLFKEKFGEIDMISFGPEMHDVHTPDERLSITSTFRTWNYLLKVLEEIK